MSSFCPNCKAPKNDTSPACAYCGFVDQALAAKEQKRIRKEREKQASAEREREKKAEKAARKRSARRRRWASAIFSKLFVLAILGVTLFFTWPSIRRGYQAAKKYVAEETGNGTSETNPGESGAEAPSPAKNGIKTADKRANNTKSSSKSKGKSRPKSRLKKRRKKDPTLPKTLSRSVIGEHLTVVAQRAGTQCAKYMKERRKRVVLWRFEIDAYGTPRIGKRGKTSLERCFIKLVRGHKFPPTNEGVKRYDHSMWLSNASIPQKLPPEVLEREFAKLRSRVQKNCPEAASMRFRVNISRDGSARARGRGEAEKCAAAQLRLMQFPAAHQSTYATFEL